jgi:hypothetical protein
VQRSTRAGCPKTHTIENDAHTPERPSMGFGTLRRLRKQAATNTELASPGCATPSGFLSLLALHSASQPFPPCFMRVTPLGFCLRRVSLPSSGDHLTAPLPFMPFPVGPSTPASWKTNASTPRLQGIAQPESPYRRRRCYPRTNGRSSLSLFPLRGFHPSSLGPVLPRNLLSWAFAFR